jgi:hypothetical protein
MQAMKAPINSTGAKWVLEGAKRRFSRLAGITGLAIAQCQAAVWSGIQGGECAYLVIE